MKKLEKVQVVKEIKSGRVVIIAASWLDARLAAKDAGYKTDEVSINEWPVIRLK